MRSVSSLRDIFAEAFRSHPGKPIKVKRAMFLTIWILPLFCVFFAWGLQVAMDGAYQSRLLGLECAGFFLLLICAVVVCFRAMLQSKAVRIFFFVLNMFL